VQTESSEPERNTLKSLFFKLHVKVRDLLDHEEGQDLVEYALLITLVALAAVSGMKHVASAINTVFSNISNTLS
jgi:pilus assembly protein Flp/PilA